MTKKQDIERDYFERFGLAYGLRATGYGLRDGILEYGDKPDVLLKGKETIGIEITRLYVQSGNLEASEQRQKPLRKGVISDAQKLYRDAGGRGIELHVGFDAKNPITSPRRKELPKQLAEFAKHIDSHGSGQVDSDLFQGMLEIGYVWLNAGEYTDAKWDIAQVYSAWSTSRILSISSRYGHNALNARLHCVMSFCHCRPVKRRRRS
jgi:hypothetical protein